MGYIGKVGERINIRVKFVKEIKYVATPYMSPSWSRRTELRYIYILKDEAENTLVWKTSTPLAKEIKVDRKGNPIPQGEKPEHWYPLWIYPEEGDQIRIKATVKGHEEYEGTKQTMIQRVMVLDVFDQNGVERVK